ncbi:Dna2/Cas4 domain-containing protein [Candidatus Woesearchaeota archaeon]|nr:Dna2/Cas4 domain-containing protein [Candidatus Woesearchaeota archaeon]
MLISVTDLSAYIYCPKSLYMQRVQGVVQPATSHMILGGIKHKVMEQIATTEKEAFLKINRDSTQPELKKALTDLYADVLEAELDRKSSLLKQFGLSQEQAFTQMKAVLDSIAESKAEPVLQFAAANNVYGHELWETLVPKTLAEVRVASKELSLRGIIDKVELYPDRCVTHEIKTGKAPHEGVWPSHRIQVSAYCMLAERRFNVQSNESYIDYVSEKKKRLVVMNPFMRQEVIDTTQKVITIIESKRPPESCGRQNCSCKTFNIKTH